MDVKVKVKFYNENFLLAIQCAGYRSVTNFAVENGMYPSVICRYASFSSYPKKKEMVQRLEKLLNVPEEYMFPPEYKMAVDKKIGKAVEVVKEVSLDAIECAETLPQIPFIEAIETDMSAEIDEMLGTLEPRERAVLEKRFGFDGEPKTLEQVASEVSHIDNPHKHLNRERVRQVESKALRKLRHPTRCRRVVGLMKEGGIL